MSSYGDNANVKRQPINLAHNPLRASTLLRDVRFFAKNNVAKRRQKAPKNSLKNERTGLSVCLRRLIHDGMVVAARQMLKQF
jgi:hypothetical protein